MAELYRSTDMQYVRVLLSSDSAYTTVRNIGQYGSLHVIDLTVHDNVPSEHVIHYKKRIQQCGIYKKKLDQFVDTMKQHHITVPLTVETTHTTNTLLGDADDVLESAAAFIQPIEQNLTQNILFKRQHDNMTNAVRERLFVIQYIQLHKLLSHAYARDSGTQRKGSIEIGSREQSTAYTRLLDTQTDNNVFDEFSMDVGFDVEAGQVNANLSGAAKYFSQHVCGVLPTSKTVMFDRMLFRVTRGNCFIRTVPITEPLTDTTINEPIQKSVFVIIFMGQHILRRIQKLILTFGATEYNVPSTPREMTSTEIELEKKLNELNVIGQQTESQIYNTLSQLAYDNGVSPIQQYLQAIQHEIAICNVLRQCKSNNDSHSTMLRLEGWVPTNKLDDLRMTLHDAARSTRQQKQAALQTITQSSSPPTHFPTNQFTSIFQGIVDTYGVPRYKEINPGLFTIISFPFLFGVMYGDVLHGTLITLFALYMIMKQNAMIRQQQLGEMGEIMSMVFAGRYMLLMMGMFAVYCGTIYNDAASVPIAAFNTVWSPNEADVYVSDGSVYPWGIDWQWYHTTNQLAFFNSFKMKLAVTLGVVQMIFGVILSYKNHEFKHDTLAIKYEFIPRLLFLLCTFGYMVLMIFIKWSIDWSDSTTAPPNLVQTMIGMFLSPGNVPAETQLYTGQAFVQVVLLLIALGSVPVMLLTVPLINKKKHSVKFKKNGHRETRNNSVTQINSPLLSRFSDNGVSDESDLESNGHSNGNGNGVQLVPSSMPDHATLATNGNGKTVESDNGHGGEWEHPNYNFSDQLITQGIHTIEYVLGTVSNTASYLRLWALSLAHAELADVFWSKILMQYGIEQNSVMFAIIGMTVWSGATFAVLLCMDVLECFLHALRLHWVEFQNKFYYADGYAFVPFVLDEQPT